MKIKPEHFEALKAAINTARKEYKYTWEQYRAACQSEQRYGWDLLHFSKFSMRELYAYLNDDHISTALRAILNDREVQS